MKCEKYNFWVDRTVDGFVYRFRDEFTIQRRLLNYPNFSMWKEFTNPGDCRREWRRLCDAAAEEKKQQQETPNGYKFNRKRNAKTSGSAYLLKGVRDHVPFEESHKMLEDAVLTSYWMIEDNTARPLEILKDGKQVWDGDDIWEFAEKRGIELPD